MKIKLTGSVLAGITTLLLILGQSAKGQDLLPIAYEDSSVIFGGKKLKCDLYYIFVGDSGKLINGDLIQVVRLHNGKNEFHLSKGRFEFDADGQNVSIFWKPSPGSKFGPEEKGVLLPRRANGNGRFVYKIKSHSGDDSQNGTQYHVQAVKYERLPSRVRELCLPTIVSKLPADEQLKWHKRQAAIIRSIGESALEYLK